MDGDLLVERIPARGGDDLVLLLHGHRPMNLNCFAHPRCTSLKSSSSSAVAMITPRRDLPVVIRIIPRLAHPLELALENCVIERESVGKGGAQGSSSSA